MFDDARNTFRFLIREPQFALAVLGTLGTAIGINAAIFSVVEAIVIRQLPYPNPDQLVVAWQQDMTDKSHFVVAPANFLDWQREGKAFESLSAVEQFGERDFNMAAAAIPESVKGVRFSAELFQVLQVQPILGRVFSPREVEEGQTSVVVLGHDLWVSRFASDPNVIGRDLRLNGNLARIIGVMPAGFEIPLVKAQIYLPLRWTPATRQERHTANYLVLGRLRTGVSLAGAAAQLGPVARAIEKAHPDSNKDQGILLEPLRDEVVGKVGPRLLLIFAASGCVLLLACFNLANLFGARGIQRQHEMAVRASLGASRSRLTTQLLTEGLVIAGLGGSVGLALGTGLVKLFVSIFNNSAYFSLPRREEICLDWGAVGFTTLVCILAGILASVVPLLAATKTEIVPARGRADGRRHSRWRSIFVVMEIGISLALLIATSLLVRSYSKLNGIDPGFVSGRTLTATIALPKARFSTPSQRLAFFRRLVTKTGGIAGVRAVAAVRFLPLSGVASVWSISIPGSVQKNLPAAFHHIISPDYFDVMGIPVVRGRRFDSHDDAGSRRVAILGEAAARRYFPNGEEPIGRSIRINDEDRADWEIIGVVGDVRNIRLDRVPRPQIYVSMEQSPTSSMMLVVSSDKDPLSLSEPIRNVVSQIDADQAVTDVRSLVSVVNDASAPWRVSAFMFAGFGATALVLALIGLYGVVSYGVAQRTREIAIRVALGCSGGGIVRMILRSVTTLAGGGLAIGLVLAAVFSKNLTAFLYAVDPLDPAILVTTALSFFVVVILAGALAAAKALAIEPAIALKAE
jgi:putative ABC transport system permease protein